MFDKSDKYVSVVTENSVFIYSLQNNNAKNPIITYRLDEEKFEKINDVILDSKECLPN